MQREKLVSIIIANWNSKDDLEECLNSLVKIDYKNIEIIVVDNGSTDGSIELVEEYSRKIVLRLIKYRTNLGFAIPNNDGFKKAKGEYILLLNNDTTVEKDFLTKLVSVLEKDEKSGVVQPKIIFADSRELQAGGSFLTNTGFLYHFGFGKNPKAAKYRKRMEIFSANGACMLIKRSVIEEVGLFDPDYFAYFEETDFCWRVWLNGYKILFVPSAVIFHKGGKTAKRFASSFINFHSFKNRINTLIKNLGTKELIKILPLHLLFCELATLVYILLAKPKAAFAIQRAIYWNIVNLGATLKKRLSVQNRIRRIGDRKLMPQIMRAVRPSYYYYLFTGLERYED